jgi:hypothetical protein
MDAFELTPQSKDMIQQIAALCGATKEDVRKVWEYTIFTMMLQIADTNKPYDRLEIPFVGHLDFKLLGKEVDSNGKLQPEVETYVVPEDAFKRLYAKVKENGFGELSEYYQKNYIHKVVKNID